MICIYSNETEEKAQSLYEKELNADVDINPLDTQNNQCMENNQKSHKIKQLKSSKNTIVVSPHSDQSLSRLLATSLFNSPVKKTAIIDVQNKYTKQKNILSNNQSNSKAFFSHLSAEMRVFVASDTLNSLLIASSSNITAEILVLVR